jgi:hypothetical protein
MGEGSLRASPRPGLRTPRCGRRAASASGPRGLFGATLMSRVPAFVRGSKAAGVRARPGGPGEADAGGGGRRRPRGRGRGAAGRSRLFSFLCCGVGAGPGRRSSSRAALPPCRPEPGSLSLRWRTWLSCPAGSPPSRLSPALRGGLSISAVSIGRHGASRLRGTNLGAQASFPTSPRRGWAPSAHPPVFCNLKGHIYLCFLINAPIMFS